MNCSNCQTPLQAGFRYCPQCATPVNAGASVRSEDYTTVKTKANPDSAFMGPFLIGCVTFGFSLFWFGISIFNKVTDGTGKIYIRLQHLFTAISLLDLLVLFGLCIAFSRKQDQRVILIIMAGLLLILRAYEAFMMYK